MKSGLLLQKSLVVYSVLVKLIFYVTENCDFFVLYLAQYIKTIASMMS